MAAWSMVEHSACHTAVSFHLPNSPVRGALLLPF